MSLPPEVEASYTVIIDELLAKSDIDTVSIKRIRKGLEARTGEDLTKHKDILAGLIESRFDKVFSSTSTTAPAPPPTTANGAKPHQPKPSKPTAKTKSSPPVKAETTPSIKSSPASSPSPAPRKKPNKSKPSAATTDAALAARLQAEENSRGARPSRTAAPKRRAPASKNSTPAKKQKKTKSASRIKAEDDSELESDGEEKEVKRTGAFHKPMQLSPALSALLDGETQLSRPQTVKKIWEYVKARDLQDPEDKRQIRCDEMLRAVFKTDRVHMFTMNKLLSNNLHPVDE